MYKYGCSYTITHTFNCQKHAHIRIHKAHSQIHTGMQTHTQPHTLHTYRKLWLLSAHGY